MTRSFFRLFRQFWPSAFLFALIGCALIEPATAAPNSSLGIWTDLRAQHPRIMGVAYRLSIANTRLCPNSLAAQSGFVLESAEPYAAGGGRGAAGRLGFDSTVGVIAVVAGSPAQRAGLAANDRLISANGQVLSDVGTAPKANQRRAKLILAAEMAKGEVVLRVFRTGGLREVRYTAEVGCALNVKLVNGGEINAWADGQRVVISDGIIARCNSDGDLALVMAHELAHNLLRHAERQAAAGSVDVQLRLTGTALAGQRENEEEADRLGVRLASAAAYDLTNAPKFLGTLLEADSAGAAAGTHPATARRLALLRAEIAAVTLERAR